MDEYCEVPMRGGACGREPVITYYQHAVCQRCWEQNCAGRISLKEMFGIRLSAREFIAHQHFRKIEERETAERMAGGLAKIRSILQRRKERSRAAVSRPPER